MHVSGTRIKLAACLMLPGLFAWQATGQDMPEYRLKSSFIYNFITFTEWSDRQQPDLTLCLFGGNPLDGYIYELDDKQVAGKRLEVMEVTDIRNIEPCEIVYIAPQVFSSPGNSLVELARSEILTIADSPDASEQYVVINMSRRSNKIVFDINLGVARAKNIRFSSRMLQLANELLE